MNSLKISSPAEKSDLLGLKNWQGKSLLDVDSKILSIVFSARAHEILMKIRHQIKFRARPSMSFVDAALSHKSILQSRIDNGIDYFAEFVDLLKVSDSTRHEIIFAALLKMSNPPKHVE